MRSGLERYIGNYPPIEGFGDTGMEEVPCGEHVMRRGRTRGKPMNNSHIWKPWRKGSQKRRWGRDPSKRKAEERGSWKPGDIGLF